MKRKIGPLFILILLISGTVIASSIAGAFNGQTDLLSAQELEDFVLQEVDENLAEEQVMFTQAQQSLRSQFYENLGQVDNDEVLFYGNIPNGMIGFGVSKIFLWLVNTSKSIVLTFDNCNQVDPVQRSLASHESNYFLGDRGTFTGVSSSEIVLYENLWDDIDLEYRATSDGAKYEFRVAPGIDPNQIKVRYEGHDRLSVSSNVLVLESQGMHFVDNNLVVTQGDTSIVSSFKQFDNDVAGFDIGPFDTSQELVIDPLVYSTFIGGSSDETFYESITDSLGNTYITGQVYSSNFPTQGAYDSTHNGNWDVVVVKLNSTGNGIIFSTFIGGSSAERGDKIYLEPDFSVFIVGYTSSSNYPVVNAFDSSHNGGWDGFITHLSSNGSTLLYSTFIGGSSDDHVSFLQFDGDGNLYGTGLTRSSNFPTFNAYDSSFNGDRDVMAFKLNPSLDTLIYSTYIGGSGYDNPYGSQIAANGDFIIAGRTPSSNYPVVNGYDSTHNGNYDIFVTRLNATGNGLVFSTFIGGSGEEYYGEFVIDLDENLYIGGSTASSNFPVLNGYDSSYNGGWDAFALKLSANGSTLEFSTYIGGSGSETTYGVEFDQWFNFHLTGDTTSTNLPIVNAYQNTSHGLTDAFIFKVNSTGTGLLMSTYLGGSGNEGTRGISLDAVGRIYIVGWTESSNFPTFNAYDSTINGGSDGFITCMPPMDDADSDGLPDYIELQIGSDPFLNDSDSDSMPDGWEYNNALNVTNPDSSDDPDFDTLTNLGEYWNGTDPWNNDTDFDLLNDGQEVLIYGTNPLASDSDLDTLTDYSEVITYGTNPLNIDTENDTMRDDWEITFGLDPLVDDSGDDPDFDLLTNAEEYLYGSYPDEPDSDFDMIDDWQEIMVLGSDPLDPSSPGFTAELEYNVWIGGNDWEEGHAITVDSSGCAYVTGYTASGDFPTVNPYDSSFGGGYDCFVVKLNQDGLIVYATYIGGTGYETAEAIWVDSFNCAYIGGMTTSLDFPFDTSFSNGALDSGEAFVLKLSASGDSLEWSCIFGGFSSDGLNDFAVREDGCIVMVGSTNSFDYPTVNAIDDSFNGNYDMFITVYDPTSSSIQFSTFIGASDHENPESVALDLQGNIYVGGRTSSLNFPMVNALDDSHNGESDCILLKLDSSDYSIVFSTYLGGSDGDSLKCIDVDPNGNLYILGDTWSVDYPVVNPLNPNMTGFSDIFISKLSSDGQSLLYSTFYGGSGQENSYAIIADYVGNVIVAGGTGSIDQTLVDPLLAVNQGNHDAFVIRLNSTGNGLSASTYLGGSSTDRCRGAAVDDEGNLYLVGYSASLGFPLGTVTGYLPEGYQCFVVKLSHFGDADNDWLLNYDELNYGSNPYYNDTDSDSMLDSYEVHYGLDPLVNDTLGDLDNDTLTNIEEYYLGTSPSSNDTDSDLLPDPFELDWGTNPLIPDSHLDMDGDTLSNLLEYQLGSMLNMTDSDSDLMPDSWEYNFGLNLTFDDSSLDWDSDGLSNLGEFLNGCDPTSGDSDSDTLGDLEEIETYGTDPGASDTDQDSLDDAYEILTLGTNPLLIDSDNDTLSDAFEVQEFGTNPLLFDTDSDTMSDGVEYLAGTDPLVADANDDEDGDGLSNLEEWNAGTDVFNVDSDGDGASDYDELMSGNDPLSYDVILDTSGVLIAVVIMVGSLIPAIVGVVLNDKTYRKIRWSSKKDTDEEDDSKGETE